MNLAWPRRLSGTAALVTAGACALALVGVGVAVAASPKATTTYTACQTKTTGAIRIIDPSLGTGNPLGHCTNSEIRISWNSVGPRGRAGVSVTTATEPPGANCAAGGVVLTGASGTSYVCNGAAGQDGSRDADTLSGHPVADFQDGCQSGFTAYGGMCWENVDVSGFTLPQAAARCGQMGGRLPLISEFAAIAASGITLTGGLQLDWSSSSAGDDQSLYVNTTDPSNLDGVRPNSTSSYARCVVPPSNGL